MMRNTRVASLNRKSRSSGHVMYSPMQSPPFVRNEEGKRVQLPRSDKEEADRHPKESETARIG